MSESAPLPSTPSFRLDGRGAFITGAGRGIGRAAAVALADAGAEVTLVARSGNEIEAVAKDIRHRGGRAHALPLDVTKTAQVAEVVASRGPFQILFNNAGANLPAELLDITAKDYDAVTNLNVRSAIFVAQAVMPVCVPFHDCDIFSTRTRECDKIHSIQITVAVL